jgi:proteasome lid subunit RPN8/RPN11
VESVASFIFLICRKAICKHIHADLYDIDLYLPIRDNPRLSMQSNSAEPEIFLSGEKSDDLIKICLDALPHKAYGLVGGSDIYHPKNFYPCSTNLRNTAEWKRIFESFGEFYHNPDLGFVVAPVEVQQVMRTMEQRKESLVGVFHSHRYLPAEPSDADISLSSDSSVFCYIVSVVNPSNPELAIFRIDSNGHQKIPIRAC